METYHRETFRYIFSLFENQKLKAAVENVFEKHKLFFFREQAAKMYHQNYPGGLADHTALTTLISYYMAKTQQYMNVPSDDALISALFHDWEKIGMFIRDNPRLFKDDQLVINYLEQQKIITETTRHIANGIVFAHGGWSRVQGQHFPIAIIIHYADMASSQNIKTQEKTRTCIEAVKKQIDEFHENSIESNKETDKHVKSNGTTI